ncbi:MAG TPA: GNAT family N-acetyltransferase [Chitinophaga sp.]|uniref:GNAT family N-acetyltransferase n=1 Tax=Chitinophaga sp. TaxID=1869181 RepID=UPI002BF01CD4|nr:GNAT family N-acetyltransferase [Chitinophaga sp.]HVI43913.1 GNAT family N-acetyltransferase [Chitinophaga sp.]
MKETILDNPAWNALCSVQAGFATGTPQARRYRQDILPFIGFHSTADNSIQQLDQWINPGESFFIIGDLPVLPQGWTIMNELPCAQMVLDVVPLPVATKDVTVSLLSDADAADMLELINAVQPGYFNTNTRLLGNYYGIRVDRRLVAMAGERMRMTGFSELSAIVTLPGFTGRGYAQLLMQELIQYHAGNGVVSFLHVALTNERAIGLYEHMGFRHRRTISFFKTSKD